MKSLSSISFILLIIAVVVFISMTSSHAAYETGGAVKNILSNGVTLIVRPEPEARTVAIEVFARVGAAEENKNNAGIGHLLAGSILSGTEGRAPLKLARLVSEVGGNFHAVWQWNYLEVYAVTVPDRWNETLGLLADSIQGSTLDPRAVEYARSSILKRISNQDSDPFNNAYTEIRRMLHRNTPYDRTYLGETSAIKSITQPQLKEFYTRNFSAEKIVISVTGNVDPDAVQRKVESRFGNMQRVRPVSSPKITPSVNAEIKNEIVLPGTAPITYIMMGYPAVGIDDPDYPTMCVANTLLGGNKSSLLFTKLREGLGLGYQVGSLYPALKSGSHIVGYIGIDTERATPDVIKTVRECMDQQFSVLRSGSFSDDDLDRAKRYLAGNHALKHERTRDRAFYLGWHEAIGLGYQYDFTYDEKIKKVTREDVQRVCGKFPDKPVFLIYSGSDSQPNEN
ncbi:MAG: M16 family metallopeptidase [Armatimonadota bacterium]